MEGVPNIDPIKPEDATKDMTNEELSDPENMDKWSSGGEGSSWRKPTEEGHSTEGAKKPDLSELDGDMDPSETNA